MPAVRREIWIDAPPEVVRELVTDDDHRRDWVGDDLGTRDPGADDGASRFVRRGDDGEHRVEIEVVPDRGGSAVRVTETVVPAADLPDDAAPGDDGTGAPVASLAARRRHLATWRETWRETTAPRARAA